MQGGLQRPSGVLAVPKTEKWGGAYLQVPCSWRHLPRLDPSTYGFSSSHVWMWELDYKEGWVPKNWCFWIVVLGEDSWESFGLQGDLTSQSQRKSALNIHWNDWCWGWNSNTSATWCKELTHFKTLMPERLKTGRQGGHRAWDGWMASLTQWTWDWANFWGVVRDREA